MITDRERAKRLREALAEELERNELDWYYISFSKNNDFAGTCIIQAFGVADALRQAHLRKINPGGQALTIKVPKEQSPKPEWINKLMSFDDMVVLGLQPQKV